MTTKPDGRSRCRAHVPACHREGALVLRLPRSLPSGTWVIVSRAVDRAGHRETAFTAPDRNRVVVSVR